MSTGIQRVASTQSLGPLESLALLNESLLGMIRTQTPLAKILDVLCEHIEQRHPGLHCSVLLLDPDGTTLRHGAAPSLPAEYSRLVDGVQIGPCAGSCGTAAYRKQSVVVLTLRPIRFGQTTGN